MLDNLWWGVKLLEGEGEAESGACDGAEDCDAQQLGGCWRARAMRIEQWDAYSLPARPAGDALDAVLRWARRHSMRAVGGETRLLLAPAVPVAGGGEDASRDLDLDLAGRPGAAPGLALCDALLTNLHQPRSTLLLLVATLLAGTGVRAVTSAGAGAEAGTAVGDAPGVAQLRAVYAHALGSSYRFLSYGDACLFVTPDASKIGLRLRKDEKVDEASYE
eukprot:g6435.t1